MMPKRPIATPTPATSFSERERPDEVLLTASWGTVVPTAAHTVEASPGVGGGLAPVGYGATLNVCDAKKECRETTGIMHRLYSTVGFSHVSFTANRYEPAVSKMNWYE